MDKTRLGRTDLLVSRSGFGAIPIQRISCEAAVELLREAYEQGINFFDTARMYTDSEEKIGRAFSGMREKVIIATKSKSDNKEKLLSDLEVSLSNLQTEYVDILQLHNPDVYPDPADPDGLYQGLLEAKKAGKTRFIGITNHKLETSIKAARSGLYDTVQFPFSSLSTNKEEELTQACKENDVGFIAMKALSGGLLTNAASTFAFLRQFENVVPIWGIEEKWQLMEFVALEKNPPLLDAKMWEIIEKDRSELGGSFCRGCGYCLPCPVEIPIPMAARMTYLLARSPYERFINDQWKEKMERINNCIECGHCRENCPYGLDTPNLLKRMLADYMNCYAEQHEKIEPQ